MDSSQMPTARGREIASTGCRHHPDASPQTERYRKRRCPTADSKAHAIDTAFGHGRPPVCFLSRQLESSRGGPGPPFHLDAILLSKCARNCTLPGVAPGQVAGRPPLGGAHPDARERRRLPQSHAVPAREQEQLDFLFGMHANLQPGHRQGVQLFVRSPLPL